MLRLHVTGTVDTATAGDTEASLVPTPTTSVNQIIAAQSQPATSTPNALALSWMMTLGQTMMDSMTHTMTLTGRHRTTLLECEAGKLHLKKGVMLQLYALDLLFFFYFTRSLLLPSPLDAFLAS